MPPAGAQSKPGTGPQAAASVARDLSLEPDPFNNQDGDLTKMCAYLD
jgi:hypothetical protein